jgi:hypothetical protein
MRMLTAIRAGILDGRTIAAVVVALSVLTTQGYGQSRTASINPFRDLAGSWAGSGRVTLSNGATERIRCRARYFVESASHAMRQDLRCASASYNFDLSSDVRAQGGTISGHWSEATRNTGGTVSGSVLRGGQIRAVVNGPGFSATLSLTTRGNRQSVHITSRGEELTEVSITLNRG